MDVLFALIQPADLSPLATAALLAVSAVGSFVTAAFGIGGGVLMIGVLAAVLPPAAVIPVHGLVQLGSNVGRAAMMLRHMLWRVLPWFLAGSFAGIAGGGRIAVALPPWGIEVGVGLFVLWSVLARPPRWLGRWPVVAGAVSSFLTMFFGATGPFVATFTKSLGLARHGYVATNAVLMSFQHLLKCLAFALLGFAYAPWIGFAAAMIAAGFAGTLLGGRALGRMTDARFGTILNVILLLIAARLVWSGAGAALATGD